MAGIDDGGHIVDHGGAAAEHRVREKRAAHSHTPHENLYMATLS